MTSKKWLLASVKSSSFLRDDSQRMESCEPLTVISGPLGKRRLLNGSNGRWGADFPEASLLLDVLMDMEVAIFTLAQREAALKRIFNSVTIVRHCASSVPNDTKSLNLILYAFQE
jgi:hypothetical protein